MNLAPRASTSRSGRLAAVLVSLSLAAGLQLGLADDASAAVTAGPVFNDPTGTVAEQRAIRTRLLDYIGQSESGSSIKAAVYHLWDESDVSDNADDPSYPLLAAALGTDLTQDSFVGLCPAGRSCLGQPALGASINHNKFWLFSQVDGASNVVVQTSSNMTPSSYSRFWNDAYVLPGNTAIYTAYSDYFAELAGKTERTGNPAIEHLPSAPPFRVAV